MRKQFHFMTGKLQDGTSKMGPQDGMVSNGFNGVHNLELNNMVLMLQICFADFCFGLFG